MKNPKFSARSAIVFCCSLFNKTPGGIVTSGISFVLSLLALTGVYAYDVRAFYFTLALFAVGMLYYVLIGRNNLVANSAEEEFALLSQAEGELAVS